jgi:hypothetical protein
MPKAVLWRISICIKPNVPRLYIQNVISVSLEEQVAEEMKGKPLSILIDEFTDVSSQKHLCITCRYFSESGGRCLDERALATLSLRKTPTIMFKRPAT